MFHIEFTKEGYLVRNVMTLRLHQSLWTPKLIMTQQAKKSRNKLYVSQAIQGRMLRNVALYWLVYHLIFWHLLFIVGGLGSDISLPFGVRYMNFFTDHFLLIICGAAILPMVLWDMLKLTHRTVGPFVRFERAMKEMAQGKQITKVTLRKKDHVTEFLGVFNEFVEYHNREIEAKNANRESFELHATTPMNEATECQEIS